nr:MAG TPA: hypothetical protein [Caudoviricetes sp.]
MTTSKSVEAKIKEVIESRGLQQKFICEKIKISQEQFSQCLRGKRKIKTVEFLAVCSLLGLNFSDFEECQ